MELEIYFLSLTLIDLANAADNEQIANFFENGAVELYYANSKKLETTNTGVDVTGTLDVSSTATFGADADDGTVL